MARMCRSKRKIARHFLHLHAYISLAIFRKAPPNSTPYRFREKEVRFSPREFIEELLRSELEAALSSPTLRAQPDVRQGSKSDRCGPPPRQPDAIADRHVRPI